MCNVMKSLFEDEKDIRFKIYELKDSFLIHQIGNFI